MCFYTFQAAIGFSSSQCGAGVDLQRLSGDKSISVYILHVVIKVIIKSYCEDANEDADEPAAEFVR